MKKKWTIYLIVAAIFAIGAGGPAVSRLWTSLRGTAWRIPYTNTSGKVTEVALGADGTVLKSNGASAAPTFSHEADPCFAAALATTVEANDVNIAGSFYAANLRSCIRMVNTGDGTWAVYEPNGASVDISASTTDGLQEALDLMTTKRANLRVTGGGKGTGVSDDYANILCTTAITFPILEGAGIYIDNVRITITNAVGTASGITVDSCMEANVYFHGELHYQGTGTTIEFLPTSELYTDPSGPCIVCSEFDLTLAITSGDLIYDFNCVSGAISNNEFKFYEGNFYGDDANGQFITTSAFSGKTFSNNKITLSGGHPLDNTTDPLIDIRGGYYAYANEWNISAECPNDGTFLRTDARNDKYLLDPSPGGPDVEGVIFDTNSTQCYVFFQRLSDAARAVPVTDNSTAKDHIAFYDGRILGGDNVYYGHFSDTDAFQIESSGDGAFTQDVNVAGTATITGGVTGHLNPTTAGSQNLGDATTYWGDVSYKTLTDRGCLGWFDEGVELQDGSKVSDVEALKAIKKHPTKKTVYGEPMLDYKTMPKVVYKQATRSTFNEQSEEWKDVVLPRDANDEPYWCDANDVKHIAADGAETTALISIMIGAIKEQAAQIDKLNKRLEQLEKDG